mgnify:CR=1 FL=1
MSHFVDQFRFKFDKEQQIVFLSVCITEQRTVEHALPALDFLHLTQAYRSGQDYQHDVLSLKIRSSDVLLIIRISQLTRRVYNLSSSDMSRMIGEFRQCVNIEEIDQNVESDLLMEPVNSAPSTGILSDSAVYASHDNLDQLHADNEYLRHTVKKLNDKIDEVLKLLQSSQPINSVSVESHYESNSSDMPMFIPTSVNTEFEGKVETKKAKATDDSVQSASDMLKQLKKGKKK